MTIKEGIVMKENYFKLIVMIERLHRLFLEVLKVELERMTIQDINNVQFLLLYNVGSEQVTVGDLTNRGYYLGSNVSYNLRKMVKNNYLLQEPSTHDRRSSHVKLSEKGMKLHDKLDKLFTMHAKALAHEGIDIPKVSELNNMLIKLEDFWTSKQKAINEFV